MVDMAVGYIDEDDRFNESAHVMSSGENTVDATRRKLGSGLFKANAAIAPSAATGIIGGALVRIVKRGEMARDKREVGVETEVACSVNLRLLRIIVRSAVAEPVSESHGTLYCERLRERLFYALAPKLGSLETLYGMIGRFCSVGWPFMNPFPPPSRNGWSQATKVTPSIPPLFYSCLLIRVTMVTSVGLFIIATPHPPCLFKQEGKSAQICVASVAPEP